MITSKDFNKANDIANWINNLEETEKNLIIEQINSQIAPEKDNKNTNSKQASNRLINTFSTSKATICPHCGSLAIVKQGKAKGNQRYRCKKCRKYFSTSTGSITYNSKTDKTKWELFLAGIIHDHTNKELSEEAGISESTAHIWRHKIMAAIMTKTHNTTLNGVIEADEFYCKASFKGAKKEYKFRFNKNNDFQVIQKTPDYELYGFTSSQKRSKDKQKRGLSRIQVCIPTALSEDNQFCGKPAGLGNVSSQELEKTYLKNFSPGVTYVTDKSPASISFAKDYSLSHIDLKAGKESRFGSTYNLQKINSFHSKLDRRAQSNRNYATKYAEEYMSWMAWLLREKEKSSLEKVSDLLSLINVGSDTATWEQVKNTEFPSELRNVVR